MMAAENSPPNSNSRNDIVQARSFLSLALPNQGCVVRIHGLTSTVGQKLNGSLAHVCAWDDKVKRYTIQVLAEEKEDESSSFSSKRRSNKPIQVRPKNLLYFENSSSTGIAQTKDELPSSDSAVSTVSSISASTTTTPIHVLLSARLEDEDSLFRAKLCISSIESQTIIGAGDADDNKPNGVPPPPFSVLVCSWFGGDGATEATTSSNLLQLKLQKLLRQNAISSKLRWYFFPAINHNKDDVNKSGYNYLSEMEHLKQLFQVSSQLVNPNAWLIPFCSDDIMSKTRVQLLVDYIEKVTLAAQDESLKNLVLQFASGKLVTRYSCPSIRRQYANDPKGNDEERWLAPIIQSAAYLTFSENIESGRDVYSDYCMHTSLLHTFYQVTPTELVRHPFSAERFRIFCYVDIIVDEETCSECGRCGCGGECDRRQDGGEDDDSSLSSWHVIQFERPMHVDEAHLSNFIFLDPGTIQDEMPYFYRLAEMFVSEEDEKLVNKYNMLSRYTVAIFRLLFELQAFSHKDWMIPALRVHLETWMAAVDRCHGIGFGRELMEQIVSKWYPIMKSSTKKMNTILNRRALYFARNNVLHPDHVGIEDVHSVRLPGYKTVGEACQVHCHSWAIPDQHYGVHECKVSSQYRPYQGIDTNVTDKKYCHMCHRPEGLSSKMLRCNRCNLVYYCSRECQKEEFPSHRKRCKYINKLKRDIRDEEAEIEVDPWGVGAETNPFEADVGNFGRNVRLIPHLLMRAELGEELYEVSKREDCTHLWQETLYHILELIRLDRHNHLGSMTRYMVPSVLLYLNRDDDCYSYIKYFMMTNHITDDNINNPKSKRGDWIFEKRPGCRFNDIQQETQNDKFYHRVDVMLLAAMVIIKLRIIAHTRALKSSMATFRDTWAGDELEPVLFVVEEFLVGNEEDRQEQQAQAGRLVGIVESQNPYIWPALLDPTTVSEYAAETYALDSLAEDRKLIAHAAASYLLVPLLRIPDASELLLQFLEVLDDSETNSL